MDNGITNKNDWSKGLKRFHDNLEQVNNELEKITPEVRARCNEVDTVKGEQIVFQHSFPCDGDVLFVAVRGNTNNGMIELTHYKWVESNEKSK